MSDSVTGKNCESLAIQADDARLNALARELEAAGIWPPLVPAEVISLPDYVARKRSKRNGSRNDG